LTRTVISAFLFLVGLNVCLGQAYKRNIEIFEQDISAELEKFLYYPDLNRNFQFIFFVTSAENNSKKYKEKVSFIISVVKKTAEKNGIRISFAEDSQTVSSDSLHNKVSLIIKKLETSYPRFGKNKFLGSKTLVREIISDLDIEISSSGNMLNIRSNISTRYKDEIDYDEREKYSSEEYSFTQAVAPNLSLFESIFFPALIITVSAVAAVLFFTIRSN
jgi:hypothetical protein